MPGEKGFRYTYAGAHVTTILNKIQTTGRPDKLNFPYIRDTWLIKNAQYGAVVELLEDMEFIDSSGSPTQLYAKYQNPSLAKKTLAEGIKKAYSQLFKAFPDAQSLPKSDISGYFKQHTGKDDSLIDKIVTTFRALCNSADFSGVGEIVESKYEAKESLISRESEVKIEPRVQLNIEIHIAADTPDDKIETIFKNMKNYLLTNE